MKTSVFIVEDNYMYSMFMQLKLDEMLSCVTHFFTSAEEALVNMHLKPRIIILDYQLEGMNGLEALKRIRKEDPDIKVIVISVQTNPQITKEIMEAGAHTYIHKDKATPEKIMNAVIEIIGQ